MSKLVYSHPTTLPYEERAALANTLIDAWEQAEMLDDDALADRLKLALHILGLPFVRVREAVS